VTPPSALSQATLIGTASKEIDKGACACFGHVPFSLFRGASRPLKTGCCRSHLVRCGACGNLRWERSGRMKAARRPHRQCGRAGAVHGSIAPASTSEGGRPPADGPAATGSEPWARAGPIRAERGARCPERRHADLRRARCADLRFGRDAVASATRRAVPSAHASRQERPLSSASAADVAGLRLLHRIGMQRGLI
jgi:hypothetical protein